MCNGAYLRCGYVGHNTAMLMLGICRATVLVQVVLSMAQLVYSIF